MVSSKCQGCCSDVTAFRWPWGRSEAFVAGRIKPGCLDLLPVPGASLVLVLLAASPDPERGWDGQGAPLAHCQLIKRVNSKEFNGAI